MANKSSAITTKGNRSGTSSRRSRVGTSPYTKVIRDRVVETLGIDMSHFGDLSPEQVHNMSRSAELAKQQVLLLEKYLEAAIARGESEAQIEAMRADYLKAADSQLKIMDKSFQSSALLSARHNQHIQLIGAKTQGSLDLINVEGQQTLSAYQLDLKERIKASRTMHQHAIKQISISARANTKAALARPQNALKEATAKKGFMDYLSAIPGAFLPASHKTYGK